MRRHLYSYFRSHSEMAQFLRFATVGMKMSVIDAGGLYLLKYYFGLSVYEARAISFPVALGMGYLLNRYFTFGGFRRGHFFRQMAGHFGVHLLGGVINFLVFYILVELGYELISLKVFLPFVPLVALFIGGICGMSFNFFFSKKLVFRHQRHARPASLAASAQPAPSPSQGRH